jgi:uncharacterized protein YjcR
VRVKMKTKLQVWEDWLYGMKPRALSKKYGVSVNTIRSWHHREAWAYYRNGSAMAMWGRISNQDAFDVSQAVSKRRKERIAETQTLRNKKKKVL